MAFPKRQAAIVGTYTTEQGRSLDHRTSASLEVEAIKGALADAGLTSDDVDGVVPMAAHSFSS
jgi:acetyl-CoA C-acetyltransferase